MLTLKSFGLALDYIMRMLGTECYSIIPKSSRKTHSMTRCSDSNEHLLFYILSKSAPIGTVMTSFTSCVLSLLLLVLAPATVCSCYVGVPYVSECGAVGQPTKVYTVFPLEHNASGWFDWGEEAGPIEGFAATNDTSGGPLLTFANGGSEYQLVFEHVYTKAGTYSISMQMYVYRNETIDDDNWCIKFEQPNPPDQWLVTVSENGCQEEIVLNSGGAKDAAKETSINLFLAAIIVSLLCF